MSGLPGPGHRVGDLARAGAHDVEDREAAAGAQHPRRLGEERRPCRRRSCRRAAWSRGRSAASAKGRAVALPTRKATPSTPASRVSVSAAATNSGVRSMPSTARAVARGERAGGAADAAAEVERGGARGEPERVEQRLGRLPAAEVERVEALEVVVARRARGRGPRPSTQAEHALEHPAAAVVGGDGAPRARPPSAPPRALRRRTASARGGRARCRRSRRTSGSRRPRSARRGCWRAGSAAAASSRRPRR